MATRQEIEAKLAAIDQRKADALKTLQTKRSKLKAQLAQLDRPSKSQRRLDARRKILLGAFVLEQLEHAGTQPSGFTFEGKRFFDWLVRPNDRTVFEELPVDPPTSDSSLPAGIAAADTPLNVPFADKDHAKSLGAHWHAERKLWFVPKGLELAPFTPWLESKSN
jgi:hypothetical protein